MNYNGIYKVKVFFTILINNGEEYFMNEGFPVWIDTYNRTLENVYHHITQMVRFQKRFQIPIIKNSALISQKNTNVTECAVLFLNWQRATSSLECSANVTITRSMSASGLTAAGICLHVLWPYLALSAGSLGFSAIAFCFTYWCTCCKQEVTFQI